MEEKERIVKLTDQEHGIVVNELYASRIDAAQVFDPLSVNDRYLAAWRINGCGNCSNQGIMYQYSDQELMVSLDLERTTFYKRKKEAINLLGTILWGYILPEMLDATWGTYLVCAESRSEPDANLK